MSTWQVKVDVKETEVDMLTIVGHKFGAPKGVAALYIRDGVQLDSFFHGGGQVLPAQDNSLLLVNASCNHSRGHHLFCLYAACSSVTW